MEPEIGHVGRGVRRQLRHHLIDAFARHESHRVRLDDLLADLHAQIAGIGGFVQAFNLNDEGGFHAARVDVGAQIARVQDGDDFGDDGLGFAQLNRDRSGGFVTAQADADAGLTTQFAALKRGFDLRQAVER